MSFVGILQWIATVGIIGYVGYTVYMAVRYPKKKKEDTVRVSITGKVRQGMSSGAEEQKDRMMEAILGKPKQADDPKKEDPKKPSLDIFEVIK